MSNYKVLLIDDDPDFISSMKIILEKAGFEFTSARTARDGIKLLRKSIEKKSQPDVILCDMMMEDVDSGNIVASYLKTTKTDIPIFLLSSIGDVTTTVTDIVKKGFAGAIQKPVNPPHIISLIHRRLQIKKIM